VLQTTLVSLFALRVDQHKTEDAIELFNESVKLFRETAEPAYADELRRKFELVDPFSTL
jgi:hypothetical protein